jgi:glycosyltransferase involved in cell wall biosynthesis
MEILMAVAVPNRREGGAAAIAYNLGREMEALGHRVTYLFHEDLLSPVEARGRFRDFLFAIRVSKHIRSNRKKYAVVDLHAPTGCVYGFLHSVFRSEEMPPYVMTLHGLDERFIQVLRREDRKGRAWHFALKNRMWHRVYHTPRFRLSIRTADAAHTYSRDVWNLLQLKYGMDPDKVAYIPNGVEERFFLSRDYPDRKPVRFLYAGSWLDQRGIFYIRDALNLLNRSFSDWTLSIAGSGIAPEGIESFFGDSLSDQIVVVPVTPAAEMPRLYAEHDLFVFPSLMEGLPSVLLEAMAGGMPVVTAETCGMVDVVEDGFNGFLVPPADATALEAALLQLCRSAELRKRLGSAARESMKRYTWQKAASKLERLFVRVQNGAAAPARRE